MRIRTRKLIGTVVLILFVAAYALLVVGLGPPLHARMAAAWGRAGELLFFLVAGLAWVLPAMPLIAWMQRPDEPG